MPRSDIPINPITEREQILSHVRRDRAMKREEGVRRELRAGRAVNDTKNGVSLTCSLYHNGTLCVNKDGAPVEMRVDGTARLVRFRKHVPVNPRSRNQRKHSEHLNERAIVAGERLARHVARRSPADTLSIVEIDDSDNYIVVGSPAPLARWLEAAYERGLIETIEVLEARRVGVVASGSAPAAATQRQAYKDLIREQRMSKQAKLDRERPAITRDDDKLAALCKCIRCGLSIADHVDAACPAPVFVADSDEARKRLPGAPDKRSAKSRKNLRECSREAATGFTANGVPSDGAITAPVNDRQRHPQNYCGKCGKHVLLHVGENCP